MLLVCCCCLFVCLFVCFFFFGGGCTNISAGVTVFVTAVASVCVWEGLEEGVCVRACECVCFVPASMGACVSLHVCMRARVCV